MEAKDVISLQESFGVMLLDWKARDIADADLHSAVSEADFFNTLRELGSGLTVGLCRRFVQVSGEDGLGSGLGLRLGIGLGLGCPCSVAVSFHRCLLDHVRHACVHRPGLGQG